MDLSRHQSVLGIQRSGPVQERVSDLERDPSLVLVEGIASEKIVVDRVPVDRVASVIPSMNIGRTRHVISELIRPNLLRSAGIGLIEGPSISGEES